jgi:tetratricopeptide (TPR) repeat protein
MDYTELFDRYIDGRLEGKELDDFEKKISNDIEFRKNLDKYIRLHNVATEAVRGAEDSDKETDQLSLKDIAKYGREKRDKPDEKTAAFKEALDLAEKDSLKSRFSMLRKNLPVQLAVAATVIVAILFTVLMLLRQNKLNNTDLFTLYYLPYVESDQVFEITRSSDNFYLAIKAFESGDYARADVLFMQLSDSAEYKVYATFYSGLNYMQMGRWEDAVKKLQDVLLFGETQVEIPARWYLGLCFLRIDDSKSARIQFEILASTKNEFAARSRRILRLMH